VGRKPKNEFIESSYAFERGTEFRLFSVKVPFIHTITLETTNPNIVKTGTTREYYAVTEQDLAAIRKEVENDPFGFRIVKIEESTRKLIDFCPRCDQRGTPKIEKKDTRDNRERTWRNKDETTRTERPVEFWLTYTHTRSKKCRICQYVNTPYPSYKQNNLDIENYFFPQVLEFIKKGSVYPIDEEQ
jgi:hypothetical protein